jgi:hypothetical protein
MDTIGKVLYGLLVTVVGGVIVFLITEHLGPPRRAPTPLPAAVSAPPVGLNSVPIPLSAACKWAYPGLATGSTSGSGYDVVCLDANGRSLGGFPDSSQHSLNDWCASPDHTDEMDLGQAKFNGTSWVCAPVQ